MSSPISPFIDLATTDQGIYQTLSQVRQLDQQIDTARAALDQQLRECESLQKQHDTLQQQSTELKGKIALQDDFINKLETQVPLIRNEKEFVASKKQLEEGRKHRGQIEEVQLEIEIRREEIAERLSTLRSAAEAMQSDFESQTAELQQQRDALQSGLDELHAQQQVLLEKIPARIRKFYEKFLERGQTKPICAVSKSDPTKKGASGEWGCTGCNMVIPPQLVNEMIADPVTPKNCPHCQRLLFLPPEVSEPEASETECA